MDIILRCQLPSSNSSDHQQKIHHKEKIDYSKLTWNVVNVLVQVCNEIQLKVLYDPTTILGMEEPCLSSSFPHPKVPTMIPPLKSQLIQGKYVSNTMFCHACALTSFFLFHKKGQLITNYTEKDAKITCVKYVIESANEISGAVGKQGFICSRVNSPPLLVQPKTNSQPCKR